MYKNIISIFILLISLFIGRITHANDHIITLKETSDFVNIAKHARIIPDPDGEYSAQDIILRYRNNIRGTQNEKDTISITSPTVPTWIVFEVLNKSNTEQWLLNFGRHDTQRSGILSNLYIYEANKRKIIYDGMANASSVTPIKNDLSVNIQKRSRALYVMYVSPTQYKTFRFTPHIQKSNSTIVQISIADKIFNFLISQTNLIIIASISITLIALLITKFIGLIPVLFYYGILYAWYNFYEMPFFSAMMGTKILPLILPVLIAITVLSIAPTSIPARNSNSFLRYILFTFIGLSFLGLYFIISTPSSPMILLTSYGLLSFSLIFVVFYLSRNNNTLLKPSLSALQLWIIFLSVGQFTIIGNLFGIIPMSSWTIHADYLMLYPQLVFAVFYTFRLIKSETKRRILYVTRKFQRTQELLKAQKSKESNDHSRLLRVIEREREIMEELRGRESERAEEMRQAKITADEANQAQAAFLAVVSHEIRTPMTGVMGMLRLLQETPLNNEQKNYLMTIKDSGDAMVSLLNDILDFSKIEDGGMSLEEIDFDLQRMTNGVIMLMKGHADQKNINLVLDIGNDVPATLHGDPTRLRQIFLNLIGNALKFTERGHVTLRIKAIDTTNSENDIIKFIVEDTGIGISPEAQEQLFTPFSQADSTISRKYGGTGLGLTICQKLVHAMGGEIKIDSTENVGTQFFFTVPFKKQSDNIIKDISQPNAHEENTQPSSPKNVLIVDDNDVNQKVITALLAQKHHTFSVASSGKEALETLSTKRNFDLILLDIEMPDMNGKDVAKHILSDDIIAHIPIIALTGNVSDKDITTYIDIGFQGHLAKPVNPEKLYELVATTTPKNNFEITPHRHNIELSENEISEDSFVIAETKIVEEEKNKNKQPHSSSTLDKAMLSGLKDGLGIAQTQELLSDLYIKGDEIIEQMKKSTNPFNASDLKDRAHELKGMAGNFGLKAVSEKAGEMEKMCKQDTIKSEDAIPRIEEMETLLERSKIAVNNFLEN